MLRPNNDTRKECYLRSTEMVNSGRYVSTQVGSPLAWGRRSD
jgi:hypothetical protein